MPLMAQGVSTLSTCPLMTRVVTVAAAAGATGSEVDVFLIDHVRSAYRVWSQKKLYEVGFEPTTLVRKKL